MTTTTAPIYVLQGFHLSTDPNCADAVERNGNVAWRGVPLVSLCGRSSDLFFVAPLAQYDSPANVAEFGGVAGKVATCCKACQTKYRRMTV